MIFDPKDYLLKNNARFKKREEITIKILSFILGMKLEYREKEFAVQMLRRYHTGILRLSNKQWRWVLKLGEKYGYKSYDYDFWYEVEGY